MSPAKAAVRLKLSSSYEKTEPAVGQGRLGEIFKYQRISSASSSPFKSKKNNNKPDLPEELAVEEVDVARIPDTGDFKEDVTKLCKLGNSSEQDCFCGAEYDDKSGQVLLYREVGRADLSQLVLERSAMTAVGSLPEAEVSQLTRKVLERLRSLKGVAHGDLNPSNVLVQTDEVFKDWGQADLKGVTLKLNYLGRRRRSRGETVHSGIDPERYTAPETSEKDFLKLTQAADVYSIGVMALEMWLGRQLTSADTKDLTALLPRPGSKSKKQEATTLSNFLSACLRPDPDTRPMVDQLLKHPFMGSMDEEDQLDFFMEDQVFDCLLQGTTMAEEKEVAVVHFAKPDLMVLGKASGEVALYDLKTGERSEKMSSSPHNGRISSIASNSTFFAAACRNNRVSVWARTGVMVAELEPDSKVQFVQCLLLGERRLAAVCEGGRILVFGVGSGDWKRREEVGTTSGLVGPFCAGMTEEEVVTLADASQVRQLSLDKKKKKKEVVEVEVVVAPVETLQGTKLSCIARDGSSYWVGTNKGGLVKVDVEGKRTTLRAEVTGGAFVRQLLLLEELLLCVCDLGKGGTRILAFEGVDLPLQKKEEGPGVPIRVVVEAAADKDIVRSNMEVWGKWMVYYDGHKLVTVCAKEILIMPKITNLGDACKE